MKYEPAEVRFWRKVGKSDGCWEWTAGRFPTGYGHFRWDADHPSGYAHRFSWQLHFGPIPEGMSVLHRCDNPPCVRPDHLFLGSQLDNVADRNAKARQAKGERQGFAVLTSEQVVAIRVRHAAGGITAPELGIEYGVSTWCIYDVLYRRTWRHLPSEVAS